MMRRSFVLSVLGLAVFLSGVMADEEKQKTEIGGVIFADYFYNLTENTPPASVSCFELTRLYLTATRNLSGNVKMKAVLEGNQPTNQLFVKNAFVEFDNACLNASVRAGVIGTPWIGHEEGIWKNRFLAKTFSDIESILNAADLGVGINGKIADKLIDYDLAVVNGEGYKAAEVSTDKDCSARVSIEPTGGLKIHLFEQIGKATISGVDRNRTIAGLSYEHAKYFAMAYLLAAKDASVNKSGFSIFGSYGITSILSLVARFDLFDPNTDTNSTKDSWNRIIGGITASVSEGVQLGLDAQLKNFEDTTVQGKNQTVIYTHLGVKY